MDLELETIRLLGKGTARKSRDMPPSDYRSQAKRIRRSTRDILSKRVVPPEYVARAFENYAASLVEWYAASDMSDMLQREYVGVDERVPGREETPVPPSAQESIETATVRLMSLPPDPARSVKEALGVTVVKRSGRVREKTKKQ
jgi:hypothetical protein